MAKTVTRKNLRLFGVDGNVNNFGQFGSVNAGSPLKTKDIATIQALAAWPGGWQTAVISSNKAPFLEDMNSSFYVMIYELFYLLQEGIAEWDGDTTYFIGSLVRKAGTNQIYQSLTDDNLDNVLPDSTDSINWAFIMPTRFSKLLGQIAYAQIPDDIIDSNKLAANAVDSAAIQNGAVGDIKITGMVASKLAGILDPTQGGTGVNYKIQRCINYTGNGLNGRTVAHGMGVTPDFVMIMSLSGVGIVSPLFWQKIGGSNGRFGNGSNGVGITNIDVTNVTLDASVGVNQNAVLYFMMAIKSQ